jgi:RNA polymerase sigma factor (TIGR02999 family)
MSDVSRLLAAAESGDPGASEQLLPLVYDELRRLAAQKLAREPSGQTLDATGLVHEAYLKLAGGQDPIGEMPRWDGLHHFFAAAAESMRRILIDNARRKKTLKHGGRAGRAAIQADEIASPDDSADPLDLLALDEALTRLARIDARKAKLVELRFFAGMTIPQAAEALGVSASTADNDWAYARSWLRLEMDATEDSAS